MLGTSWSSRFSFGLATAGGNGLTYLYSDGTCSGFDVDRWYHIAGVYDGLEMRLYVNGQLCNSTLSQSGAIDYPPAADFVIGMYKDDDEHHAFDGQMAETRLWQTVRTPQQLQQTMNVRLAGNEAGLVGYWPLNEGTGAVTSDNNNNAPAHGQLYNTLWAQDYLPIIDYYPAAEATNPVNVLAFDSNNNQSYITLGDVNDVSSMVTDSFTVESWVNPSEFDYWGGIIGAFQDNGASEFGWVLYPKSLEMQLGGK